MDHIKQEPLKGFETRSSGLSRIHSRTNREVREILDLINESTDDLTELYNESYDLAGCKRNDETTDEFEDIIFHCWNVEDIAKTKDCLVRALAKVQSLENRINERSDDNPRIIESEELNERLVAQRREKDQRRVISM